MGFIHLMGYTAIGHLIVLCFFPLVTRLYLPADFGILGLVSAFIGVFSAVGCLGFDLGIAAARDDHDARGLANLSIWSSLVVGSVSLLVIAIMWHFDVGGFGAIPPLIVLLVPISIALTSIYGAFRASLVRREEFKLVGRVVVIQNSVRALGQVSFGVLGAGGSGLVIAELLCRVSGILRLSADLRLHLPGAGRPVLASMDLARRYRGFPLLTTPAVLINALGLAIQIPVISHYYGVEFAGQFTLIQALLAAPSALVGQSVGEVVQGRLASLQGEGFPGARSLVSKVVAGILIAGSLPAAVMWFAGPGIFSFVFGGKWATAGELSGWMGIWFVAMLTAYPIDKYVFARQWHGMKIVFNTMLFIAFIYSAWIIHSMEVQGVRAVSWLSALMAGSYVMYAACVLMRRGASASPKNGGGQGG